MEKDWDLERKNLLDRFHLSVQELSELGIGWLITSMIILYITGIFDTFIQEGRIPHQILIYLFVLGISFFTHELMHKYTAIRYGAKAHFRLSREGLFITLISLIIRIPILAVGAVFWWGEATASTGIRGRVSAAGPISNLILAGISFCIYGLGFICFNISAELAVILINIGSVGIWLNCFLGIFNLLPIGVLDGAKVLAWDPKVWISLIGSLFVIGFFTGNLF